MREYDWCQGDHSPQEDADAEFEEAARAEKNALLAEYRAKSKQADANWNEYLATESPKAFANHLAMNRELSALAVELIRMGMTVDEMNSK